ncbi:MAG: UDP-N-acetylmuramoyl-tripeptide--D-alanyl-D-alanine ligase [Rhodobacteraceae bacterium]|nr:UDP-N-acetylmuramoyl-tripeptide--D-alanyl-D-alanine ligase [Paracoccaceae bacterium]
MSVLWTSDEAGLATGGQNTAPWQAGGVSIDTRTLRPGDLFVALTSQRDGHDFVAQALARGAAAALVLHRPQGVARDAPLLIVTDVLAALGALGRAARARMGGKVIAVTGSVGKTTTKDMLRVALTPQGRTHAAEASYNNHWGVPLTLARMPAATEFAVIEIGMNAPEEVAPLSRMARPHVAMVTNVAAVHLEAFGTIEAIAYEKASIYKGLEPGGVALFPADLPTTPILEAAAAGATLMRFGEADGANARLASVAPGDTATVIQAEFDGAPIRFKLAAPGRHLALNAVAALAAAHAAGADPARAARALGTWRAVAGRGLRERVVLDSVGDRAVEMFDDAFNASPASVAASLEVLAAAPPQGQGRRIAVLGDMLELGPDGPAMHAALAALPAMEAIDLVLTSGPLMAHLDAALPANRRGPHTNTPEDMAKLLPGYLRAGDIVLIKGSKGSKLSLVVDTLRKLGQDITSKG